MVGVYAIPCAVVVPIVGGRDGQGFRIGRNLSLNQILLCAVSDIILLIRRIFGKQVIIGLAIVSVVQRVGNRFKGNCAVSIVDGACNIARCAVRHGDVGGVRQLCVAFVYLCRFEFELELTVGQIHRAVFIFVEFLGLNNKRLGGIFKDVGKRGSRRLCVCVSSIYLLNIGVLHFQLAAAIVLDSNGHTVEGAVIRNTGDFIGGDMLGDVVHIRAGFIEGDTSEVKFDRLFGGGALSTKQLVRCIAFAIICLLPIGQRGAIGDSLQFEAKLI